MSDTLRKFIKNMLTKSDYKNQSDLIRTALTKLMNDSDTTVVAESPVTEGPAGEDTAEIVPNMTGDVILVTALGDDAIRTKIHKIERQHAPYIKSKSVVNSRDLQSIFYVYEGSITDFQNFTTSLNSIKDIRNLRYIILES